LDPSVKEKWHENSYMSLMSEVLARAYQDLSTLSEEYLDNRGIRGFHIGNTVKIASNSGLMLDLEGRVSYFLSKAVWKN
jgi:hypothetical protein